MLCLLGKAVEVIPGCNHWSLKLGYPCTYGRSPRQKRTTASAQAKHPKHTFLDDTATTTQHTTTTQQLLAVITMTCVSPGCRRRRISPRPSKARCISLRGLSPVIQRVVLGKHRGDKSGKHQEHSATKNLD